SFAGATPEHLLSFTRRFPRAVVVRLHRDYRSTPQVVELANRLVAAGGGSGGGPRLRLAGQRPNGPPPTFAEFDDEPAEAAGAARERWESLAALVSLADDLVALDARAHLPELVAELDQRAAAQHAPTVQGVTLASLHAAKGLEWDAVFLVGLTDVTVPIQRAN